MTYFWIGLVIALSVVLIVGITSVTIRYHREIRVFRERVKNLGSQVIETDCGPIEYLRSGEGYPLLVVHGAMGGFDQGLWLAHGFDVADYQIIAPSRFGYLRSPVPKNANLDLQADAFAQLLDALGIKKAAVFAISSGTTSAIRFTARYPERVSGLVLLSPDSPGEVQMAIPPRFIFDTFFGSDFIHWAMVTYGGRWMQTMVGLAPRGYALTPEYEALLKKVMLGDLPCSQRIDGMIFESFTSLPEFQAFVSATSPYPLSQIETPVLVINAEDDPISIAENVRNLAEQMPNARRFVAQDGGHLFFGHTEEVKAEIAQFLRICMAEMNSI